jgi:VWFA-related protein
MRTSIIAAALAAFATVCGARVFASRQDVYVTLVHTHFTVTDPQGRLVTTLGRDDVKVFDNDAAKPLADFSRHVDAPVSVAVLVDRSQSVSDRFPVLASAATAFERSILKGRDDRGLAVAFDSKVYLLEDWTSDAARLAASIERLTSAGGTSMFDAVYKTCRDKFEITDTRRNALVLVTDGEDSTSLATLDQALQMATISRVAIYAVSIRAEDSLNPRDLQGHRVLARLADLTGGRVFSPNDQSPAQLDGLFAKVGDEISNSYTASYYLDVAPDRSFHRIRIEPKDKTLVVHAPSGYYARPASQ